MRVKPQTIVAACMPVEAAHRARARQENGFIPKVVPGSIETRCRGCNMRIWLGPRQAAAMARNADVTPACVWCCIELVDSDGAKVRQFAIANLKNPDSGVENPN